jgi:hypothetical protein
MMIGNTERKRRGYRKNCSSTHLAKGGEVDQEIIDGLNERSSKGAGVITSITTLTTNLREEQEMEKPHHCGFHLDVEDRRKQVAIDAFESSSKGAFEDFLVLR